VTVDHLGGPLRVVRSQRLDDLPVLVDGLRRVGRRPAEFAFKLW